MATKKRIVIADDHDIIRDGLRALLETEPDVAIVGTVRNGRDAERIVAELKPDLLIVDISMPLAHGPRVIEHVKRRHPDIHILVLTFHTDHEHVHTALLAGADSYVLKDDTRLELLNAIRAVLAGKMFLSPAISRMVVKGFLGNVPSGKAEARAATLGKLSGREREVLKLVAEGYRTREIAAQLCLSQKTIEKHRSNLMRKLNLRTAAAAAAYAIANGVVRP